MPRVGFAQWILSWVTKPLVRAFRPFESVLSFIKRIVPQVPTSRVADAYRAAEKSLGLQPVITAMDRKVPYPIEYMVETRNMAPRRYLVTFEALVRDPSTREVSRHPFTMYFNERMSASGYEQAFLGTRMGGSDVYDEEILGAEVIEVAHFAGMDY